MPQLGLDHSMWEVGEILPDFHALKSFVQATCKARLVAGHRVQGGEMQVLAAQIPCAHADSFWDPSS